MGTASQPLHAEQIGALLDTQSWGRSLQILQATASTMAVGLVAAVAPRLAVGRGGCARR